MIKKIVYAGALSLCWQTFPIAYAETSPLTSVTDTPDTAPDAETSALAPLADNWLDRRFKAPGEHLVDNNAHDSELFNQPEKAEPIANLFATTEFPSAHPNSPQ